MALRVLLADDEKEFVETLAERLDLRGDRIDASLDRKGDRADRRWDRRGNRFERRWDARG